MHLSFHEQAIRYYCFGIQKEIDINSFFGIIQNYDICADIIRGLSPHNINNGSKKYSLIKKKFEDVVEAMRDVKLCAPEIPHNIETFDGYNLVWIDRFDYKEVSAYVTLEKHHDKFLKAVKEKHKEVAELLKLATLQFNEIKEKLSVYDLMNTLEEK